MEAFFYRGPVEAHEVFSLAIRAFREENAEAAGHLLRAYIALEEGDVECCTPDGAYEVYLGEYFRALRRGRMTDDDYMEVPEPEWPEGPLPRRFVAAVARTEASHDRTSMRLAHDLFSQDEKT